MKEVWVDIQILEAENYSLKNPIESNQIHIIDVSILSVRRCSLEGKF